MEPTTEPSKQRDADRALNITTLWLKNRELELDLRKVKKERSDLSTELLGKTVSLLELKMRIINRNDENEGFKKQLDLLQKSLDESKRESSTLEASLCEQASEFSHQLAAERQVSKDQKVTFEETLKQQLQIINELRSGLEEECRLSSQRLDDYEKLKVEQDAELVDMKKKLDQVLEDRAALSIEANNLRSQLVFEQQKSKGTKSELEKAEQNHELISQKVESLLSQLTTECGEVQRLSMALEEAEMHHMTLSTQNQALRVEVEVEEMKCSDLKADFDKVTITQASLASQNRDLESELTREKEKVVRLRLESDALRNEIVSTKDIIKQVQVKLEGCRKDNSELRSVLAGREETLSALVVSANKQENLSSRQLFTLFLGKLVGEVKSSKVFGGWIRRRRLLKPRTGEHGVEVTDQG